MRSMLFRTLIAAGFVLALGFAPVRAQTGQIFGEIVGKVVRRGRRSCCPA